VGEGKDFLVGRGRRGAAKGVLLGGGGVKMKENGRVLSGNGGGGG
jgi:hypothetical protein